MTLSYVAADRPPCMAYARTPRIAAVMSFSARKCPPDGEVDMLETTERIDRSRASIWTGPSICRIGCTHGATRSKRPIPTSRASSNASVSTIRSCCFATRCGTLIRIRLASHEDLMNPTASPPWFLCRRAAVRRGDRLHPGLHRRRGRVFGLFKLDIYKDALHVASGVWAGVAASGRGARRRSSSGYSARSISSTASWA